MAQKDLEKIFAKARRDMEKENWVIVPKRKMTRSQVKRLGRSK